MIKVNGQNINAIVTNLSHSTDVELVFGKYKGATVRPAEGDIPNKITRAMPRVSLFIPDQNDIYKLREAIINGSEAAITISKNTLIEGVISSMTVQTRKAAGAEVDITLKKVIESFEDDAASVSSFIKYDELVEKIWEPIKQTKCDMETSRVFESFGRAEAHKYSKTFKWSEIPAHGLILRFPYYLYQEETVIQKYNEYIELVSIPVEQFVIALTADNTFKADTTSTAVFNNSDIYYTNSYATVRNMIIKNAADNQIIKEVDLNADVAEEAFKSDGSLVMPINALKNRNVNDNDEFLNKLPHKNISKLIGRGGGIKYQLGNYVLPLYKIQIEAKDESLNVNVTVSPFGGARR